MATKQTSHCYDKTRIVLYENDADVRQTIKSTLIRGTFSQTLATSSFKTAQSAIFNNEADMFVVDIDNEKDDLCTLMRKIRHHQIGDNPFPVSVALSNHSDFKHIRKAVNSGFDVLLLKPFSMTTFMARVHHLMYHRSPFSVNADYIGPDRRTKERNKAKQGSDKLITVPNPLAIMGSGKVSVALMNQSIQEAISQLNEQRVKANGEKASEIIEEMASRYMLNELDHIFVQNLEKLNFIGKDMNQRLKRSKFGHVAELSDTLSTVVSKVLRDPMNPASKDIELLQNLGKAIDRAFQANEGEIGVAQSISETVRAVA
ncbi:MAG: response regulator [Proteobacteria bacterium]|nr:response regulator [Pseudomonadota bacterium]